MEFDEEDVNSVLLPTKPLLVCCQKDLVAIATDDSRGTGLHV